MVWSITRNVQLCNRIILRTKTHPSTNTALTLFASNPDTVEACCRMPHLEHCHSAQGEITPGRSQSEVGRSTLVRVDRFSGIRAMRTTPRIVLIIAQCGDLGPLEPPIHNLCFSFRESILRRSTLWFRCRLRVAKALHFPA